MSVFGAYSAYYDLLYRDKDYPGEAAYVDAMIHRHAPAARRLLDLGCGTGVHAALLARSGWEVHGVDQSETMLEGALQRRAALPEEIAGRMDFTRGDVRTYRHPMPFDAVTALFHVASYQTANQDLDALFQTATENLSRGGIFFFDFWYGPAVLSQRPEVRIRRLASDTVKVVRLAEPVLHPNVNIVDVNYEIQVTDLASGERVCLQEDHRMRYLFLPEVQRLLQAHGFQAIEEWMTGKEPGEGSWGVCVAAVKP